MTNNQSFLFVRRLVVIKNSRPVYDQAFERGINIIRGDNGTGKSTIMDLMYFALGAELTDWTSPPLSCDKVYIEVETNSGIFTLSRDIDESGKSPMCIFEGGFDDSMEINATWFKYLNRRSEERHSYSQQLFDLMLLPQHKNDDHANLTMHQLLRLIYVDQITSPTKILRYDSVYDSSNIRQAVGEYLLGLDDLDIHKLRQSLLSSEKKFEKVDGELKAIYRILGTSERGLRTHQLLLEISKVEEEIKALNLKKKEVRFKRKDDLNASQKKRAESLIYKIDELTKDLEKLNDEKVCLSREIIDSTLFIDSIDYRIKTLKESKVTSESLGGLTFKYCPACLSPLEGHDEDGSCGLCKSNTEASDFSTSHIHMLNELEFQKRESERILASDKQSIELVKNKIPLVESSLSQAKSSYSDYLQSNSSLESELSSISSDIGFSESQLEMLKERMDLSQSIEDLIRKKEGLILEISNLKELIEQKKENSAGRVESVYSNLESLTLETVKSDLDFETDFIHASEFDFNFQRDRMSLNGKSKFSASSMVLLKNAFRLSILIESTFDTGFRYPRILLMDNIEDKGMMPERSHNFQNVLVESCSRIESPYQVIFTTSMISPYLNDSGYCRGKFYKRGDHTLEF